MAAFGLTLAAPQEQQAPGLQDAVGAGAGERGQAPGAGLSAGQARDDDHGQRGQGQGDDDPGGELRGDVTEVSDPRAQALFETAAEVLAGLRTAFVDYGDRNERAWTGRPRHHLRRVPRLAVPISV